MKEDETPTSIGGELRQFHLGGSPISFQDKASGGSQAWSMEECFAFDHAAARTPEAFLKCKKITQKIFSEKEENSEDTERKDGLTHKLLANRKIINYNKTSSKTYLILAEGHEVCRKDIEMAGKGVRKQRVVSGAACS